MRHIRIRDILAFIVVIASYGYFFYISSPHFNPKDSIGDVKILIGSILTLALTYYFGTSKGSTEKDDSIKSLINNQKDVKEQSNPNTGSSGTTP